MKVVVGVDSGGSKTRALAVTLDGKAVGYGESGGGHPFHDARHVENVRDAIRAASEGHEAVRIVAGIAGLDRPSDQGWADEAVTVPEENAARTAVNDTEIAHHGAFGGAPGILTIQGTGSHVMAILPGGRRISSGAFSHYARAGAVLLGVRGVQTLLREPEALAEPILRQGAFAAWGVSTIEGLREVVARQRELTEVERSERYGAVARAVTASAENGGPWARAVCEAAAGEIVDGVRLLGPMFEAEEVPVAMIGSCGRSEGMRRAVEAGLRTSRAPRYRVVEPAYPPVVGAVLMALREEGVALDEGAARRLGVRSR